MLIRIAITMNPGETCQAVLSVLNNINEFELVTNKTTLDEVNELLPEVKNDILVVNLSIIDSKQLALLQHIQGAAPSMAVIGIGVNDDKIHLLAGSGFHLSGFLRYDEIQDDLAEAVYSVAVGGTWLQQDKDQFVESANFGQLLTDREIEILGMLGAGKTNIQIARALAITVRTVRFHVSNILQKLGAANRTEAVMKAVQMGILDPYP